MIRTKKLFSILLSVCLFLITFPAYQADSASAANSDIKPIKLTINWQNYDSDTLSSAFGLNIPSDFYSKQTDKDEYNNIMEYVRPGFVRYIAPSLGKWYNKQKKEWNIGAIRLILNLVDSSNDNIILMPMWEKGSWLDDNSDGLLDRDKVDDYARLCGQLVKLVNKDYDKNIEYWEIPSGQEGLYFTNSKSDDLYEKAEKLAYIFHRVSAEMKAADPSISIGISVPSNPKLYNSIKHFIHEIVDREAYDLDYITLLSYADIDKDTDSTDLYDEAYAIIKHIQGIKDIIKKEDPSYDIEIMLGEYGTNELSSNRTPQFGSHIKSVFNALVMAYARDIGISTISTCNDIDPSAHVLQVFNNYLTGTKVQSSSGDKTKIISFAAIDKKSKNRSYLVINRSNDVQLVDIQFRQGSPHDRAIQQHQISEAGYTIKSSSWNKIANNIIAVPAHSITLWTDIQTVPSILPSAITVIRPHSSYRMPSLSTPIISGNKRDTTPPSKPKNLTLLSLTSTTAALKWDAATDNRAVKKYNIYYGYTQICSVDSTSNTCFIQGLMPDTYYYGFYVRAEDEAGNQSEASPALYFTTSRDTQSPTAPVNPDIESVNSTTVRLSWESSFDDVEVTGYEIFLNNAQIATTNKTAYQYKGLKSGREYNFSIRARDAAGNRSEQVNFVRSESPPQSPPHKPTSLRELLKKYISSGKLKHPLGKQLYNFLDQAERHMNNRRTKQAFHQLQKMKKHLNRGSMKKFITDNTAKEKLLEAIEDLIKRWED